MSVQVETQDRRLHRKISARLVACGYSQEHGIDYKETFTPVVRLDSVGVILSIVAREELEMVDFDVKTAFLNGTVTEEIYMDQRKGYEQGDKVCRLHRSLYGLKQASRAWNDYFVEFLEELYLTAL